MYKFEKRFQTRLGNKHGISFDSSTAALLISLLLANIDLGDKVIITPLKAEPTNVAIKLVSTKVV